MSGTKSQKLRLATGAADQRSGSGTVSDPAGQCPLVDLHPPVFFDAHMHIQSGACAPSPCSTPAWRGSISAARRWTSWARGGSSRSSPLARSATSRRSRPTRSASSSSTNTRSSPIWARRPRTPSSASASSSPWIWISPYRRVRGALRLFFTIRTRTASTRASAITSSARQAPSRARSASVFTSTGARTGRSTSRRRTATSAPSRPTGACPRTSGGRG